MGKVRAISFDITGTILTHKFPIFETYSRAAFETKLSLPPSPSELKPAFKKAYSELSSSRPCFRYFPDQPSSSRKWWYELIKLTLNYSGRVQYSEAELKRYFRWIYQHFGSKEGFEVPPDVVSCLEILKKHPRVFSLGVTTNTPLRSIESVLPMLNLHQYFSWFVCCEEVGYEKPQKEIFDVSFQESTFWVNTVPLMVTNSQLNKQPQMPSPSSFSFLTPTPILHPLRREEVLHVGDDLVADFIGAKGAGFQALLLDREGATYAHRIDKIKDSHEWRNSYDYPGKSEEDMSKVVIRDFHDLLIWLKESGNI